MADTTVRYISCSRLGSGSWIKQAARDEGRPRAEGALNYVTAFREYALNPSMPRCLCTRLLSGHCA